MADKRKKPNSTEPLEEMSKEVSWEITLFTRNFSIITHLNYSPLLVGERLKSDTM